MRIGIITGASSGMGWEMALQIDREFQNLDEIWLIARRKSRLESLATLITKRVRCIALDLSDCRQLFNLQGELEKANADVKILVNAAGFGITGKVGEATVEEELDMIRVNCEALTGVTRVVIPFMHEWGRIIQFASSAAFLPQPNFAIYAATKSYALSFSRALGVELKGRKIVVTSVCPGPVATEFFDIAEKYHKSTFLKRMTMAKPQQVVRKALEDCRKGKTLSIYGFAMKSVWVLSKVLPQQWILKVEGWFF